MGFGLENFSNNFKLPLDSVPTTYYIVMDYIESRNALDEKKNPKDFENDEWNPLLIYWIYTPKYFNLDTSI